jgi:hypothetical protein
MRSSPSNSAAFVCKAEVVAVPGLDETQLSYGPVVRSLEARVSYYDERVWIRIAITVLGFVLLFGLVGGIGWVEAVLSGVVGKLITDVGQHLIAVSKHSCKDLPAFQFVRRAELEEGQG